MALPDLARLKSQLATSSIRETDNATWQVINQLIDFLQQSNTQLSSDISGGGGGGGTGGITQLVGDVAAGPGIGIQIATIQPDAVTTPKIINGAVTYEKMQQVTQTEVLLGNGNISAPNLVQEIGVGSNLSIIDTTLQIINNSGDIGLGHKLLSETHIDTIPDDAVFGDLIYAGIGAEVVGTYAHAVLNSSIIEDFVGIRSGYQLGFNHLPLGNGNVGWGAPPPLNYNLNPLPNTWLTWNLIDGFLLTSVIEDFIGIRNGYLIPYAYVTGNNGAYSGPLLDTIPISDLVNLLAGGTDWTRLPIGIQNQLLQVKDGIPSWQSNIIIPGSLTVIGSALNFSMLTQAGLLNLTSGQIKFPSTQNVALDPNTLDDYEEGTWTPAYATSGIPFTSVTYGQQIGSYTKIGNVVTVTFQLYTDAVTIGAATGNIAITGLPFAAGAIASNAVLAFGWVTANPTAVFIGAGASQIEIIGATVANIGIGATNNFVGGTAIYRAFS